MRDDQCSAALKLGGLREQPQQEVIEDELFARTRATEFCFDFAMRKIKQSAGRMFRPKCLSSIRSDYYLPETFGPM